MNRRSGNPARRAVAEGTAPAEVTVRDWIAAARPRTLPVAVAPVLLGSAAAFNAEGFHLGLSLACLLLAVLLQIGVNFANDWADGVRGTDANRVGPARLVGAGRVDAAVVKRIALAFLAAGGVAGVVVVLISGRWLLLVVGVACLAAAWFYTAGRKPYGYLGLGELMAFIFFGPVATIGTVYATIGRITVDSVALGVAVGCFSAALMLVNNLRDLETDRAAGKRTLPGLIGARATRVLFAVLIAIPFVLAWLFAQALAYGSLPLIALLFALPAVVVVAMGRGAKDLITALGLTGITTLVYGITLAVAIWGGPAGFVLQ